MGFATAPAFADNPPAPAQSQTQADPNAPDLKEGTSGDADEAAPGAGESSPPAAPANKSGEPDLKPRFRVQFSSMHRLIAEILRSRSGTLVQGVADIVLESVTRSADGLDQTEVRAVLDSLRAWPDTSADLCTFAPDLQGRARWAVRLDWPVDELRQRLSALLGSETAREMLAGIRLRDEEGVAALKLRQTALGYLLPAEGEGSLFATHRDLLFPADRTPVVTEKGGASPPLLVARLNLAGTEKDSGGGVFSSFSVITAVTYAARVDAEGAWKENIDVLWPPISGMGLKAFFGKVKQTFFVPEAALGALAVSATPLPGIFDQMAGFTPQFGDEGESEESDTGLLLGPLTAHGQPELGIVVLPGTGFLPAPDFVIQTRLRKSATVVDAVRQSVKNLNRAARQREAREEWYEIAVDDRPVFWRDSAANARGLMPFAMKPVIFTTKERDARDAERDFLIVAFTTTAPDQLVRRWLAYPRTRDRRYVPADAKTSGEMWINWKDAYRLIHPYLDLVLNVGSSGALLPHADRLAAHLTPGRLTAQVKYAGLQLVHEGPMPVGVLVLPPMLTVSLEPDTSGSSDLAREQFAVQRLQVLHHHAQLFHKDVNRWPAELRELDGYVDFAAHPELFRLQVSSGKAWSDWFASLSEEKKTDVEEEDDSGIEFNDKLYVIEWRKDRWSLGYAPNTFEHLDRLYIDQDGAVHRIPAADKPATPAAAAPPPESAAGSSESQEQEEQHNAEEAHEE